MIIEIDGILISEEIVKNRFVCDINSCKGACCWEGDYGAPVTESEKSQINENVNAIKNYLPESSVKLIEKEGGFDSYDNQKVIGTRLHADGSCVFLKKDKNGIGMCSIEQAYNDGNSSVQKPMSCHLYPIRVIKDRNTNFESWHYDKWDICQAACSLGDKLNIPIYKFAKDAIIRYQGPEFYNRLHDAAQQFAENKSRTTN